MPHRLHARYRSCLDSRGFFSALLLSFLAFCGSIVITYFASAYATARASNFVTDLILSNTPALEVDEFFVYGAALLTLFVLLLLLLQPKRVPFLFFALSLFFTIRAGFISLTHIALYPIHTPIDFTTSFGIFLSRFFLAGGDGLFFSAHTGVPFLLALIFWRHIVLRYVFLVSSVFFAGVVLLGHLHYSIDVASAYFITYTIFVIAQNFFRDEWNRFNGHHI